MWLQRELLLAARERGFFLITDEIIRAIPELSTIQCGVMHVFIQHTSASLTINENADITVRQDLQTYFDNIIPEGRDIYRHNYEGIDDMPAHIKSSILGNSISIPITEGQLNLGVWQGIYLGEHRHLAGNRKIIITINGELKL